MSDNKEIRKYFSELRQDPWRLKEGFSPELSEVHSIIFDRYARPDDMRVVLLDWLQSHQPCLFGKIAAAQNHIYVAVLTEDELRESDSEIRRIIAEHILQWKRQALSPEKYHTTPATSMVVWVASERLCAATPDATLHRLARHLREMISDSDAPTLADSDIRTQHVYLEEPLTEQIYQFGVFLDFFAAQGDGRWWHDHRIPGGLAFTANSLGYMRRYREWYSGKSDQTQWCLQNAMLTIDRSTRTLHGRATSLRPLYKGATFTGEANSPLADYSGARSQLRDKDWSRYNGYLHTDHSVREDLFREELTPPTSASSSVWLQDFDYIYRPDVEGHAQLFSGSKANRETVLAEIGAPDSWKRIAVHPFGGHEAALVGSAERERAELESRIAACRRWRLTSNESREIMDQ